MKNYIQPGDVITLAAPYDVLSGDGVLVGSIFGVACFSALSGANVEVSTVGVYNLKKKASQAWTVGARVYWDAAAKEATSTATSNTLIGVAVAAVGGGAGEVTGRVRLNGAF